MSSELLEELMKRAEELTPSERLLLAARVIEGLRQEIPPTYDRPRYRWTEVRGMLPHPALGEDAQAYLSRTRRGDTEQRERQLKRGQ